MSEASGSSCYSCGPCDLNSSKKYFFFFLKNPAPTDISPLPLHDALPIKRLRARVRGKGRQVLPQEKEGKDRHPPHLHLRQRQDLHEPAAQLAEPRSPSLHAPGLGPGL